MGSQPSTVPPNCSANRRALSRPAEARPAIYRLPRPRLGHRRRHHGATSPTAPMSTCASRPRTPRLRNCAYGLRDRIGVVEFLEIDNSGRMFVLTENIPNSSKRAAAAFVVRFFSARRAGSVYYIPLQESVALSRRFIAISPDGDVYFLRSRKSEVDVVGVGSRTVRSTAVIDNPSLPRLADNEARIAGKGPLAAVRPLTRQQWCRRHSASKACNGASRRRITAPTLIPRVPGSTASGDPAISSASLIRRCAGCLIVGGATAPQSIPHQDRERHARRQTCAPTTIRVPMLPGSIAPPS